MKVADGRNARQLGAVRTEEMGQVVSVQESSLQLARFEAFAGVDRSLVRDLGLPDGHQLELWRRGEADPLTPTPPIKNTKCCGANITLQDSQGSAWELLLGACRSVRPFKYDQAGAEENLHGILRGRAPVSLFAAFPLPNTPSSSPSFCQHFLNVKLVSVHVSSRSPRKPADQWPRPARLPRVATAENRTRFALVKCERTTRCATEAPSTTVDGKGNVRLVSHMRESRRGPTGNRTLSATSVRQALDKPRSHEVGSAMFGVLRISGGIGYVPVRLLVPHQGESGSTPGQFTPDFREWESCQTIPLVREFSRGSSSFPCPVIPALLHAYLTSPSSALKTTMFKSLPNLFTHGRLHHRGSKLDPRSDVRSTQNCCTILDQSWIRDRDEVNFEPPKLEFRNLDPRSAAIVDKCWCNRSPQGTGNIVREKGEQLLFWSFCRGSLRTGLHFPSPRNQDRPRRTYVPRPAGAVALVFPAQSPERGRVARHDLLRSPETTLLLVRETDESVR
ncbi:hypothetical protein PR048_032753 [Dryococelus australis]|uniref:Uncharacterized protein n=1 Tax=Dryococelus australis TaxID=614101 RepID=A0ABQ9G5X9_9NEOP|nr:hypothetical protein PR048_032753 [Dryococelus australis]